MPLGENHDSIRLKAIEVIKTFINSSLEWREKALRIRLKIQMRMSKQELGDQSDFSRKRRTGNAMKNPIALKCESNINKTF